MFGAITTSTASARVAHRRPTFFRLRRTAFSTSPYLALAPRRSQDFNSGFTSSYDPGQENGRGPIFAKSTFGVPQFYPRDLKRRVDDYVVGQDRAKKTICSVIFNHYQGLRRRQHHEAQDQRLREKLQRQRFAQDRDLHERLSTYGAQSNHVHPVEGGSRSLKYPLYKSRRHWADDRAERPDEFPGHNESVRVTHQLAPEQDPFTVSTADNYYAREDESAPNHVKIDKSNLLLLGPTGVGKTYILEYMNPS